MTPKQRNLIKRRAIGSAIIACGLLLFPVMAVGLTVAYYTDGTYTKEVYPLDKAPGWLNAAQSLVPYEPKGVQADTSKAWSLLNESSNASGYGMGSPCVWWPVPQQTYGYSAILLSSVVAAVGYYESHGGFFSNSTITSWSGVSNALGTVSVALDNPGFNGVPSVAGCLWLGNAASMGELFLMLFGPPILLVVGRLL